MSKCVITSLSWGTLCSVCVHSNSMKCGGERVIMASETPQGNQPLTVFQENKNTFQVSLINNNIDCCVTVFLYLGNATSRRINTSCLRFTAEKHHLRYEMFAASGIVRSDRHFDLPPVILLWFQCTLPIKSLDTQELPLFS